MRAAELGVVEGTLDQPLEIRSCAHFEFPGDLKLISQILELPIIAVLSVPDAADADFHLPCLPEGIDGVVIDRLPNPEDLPRLRRLIRLACDLPVLGALERLPSVRHALELARARHDLPEEVIATLGQSFLRHCDLGAIRELARSRSLPEPVDAFCACGLAECTCGFRVAYAWDEAFGRYFPDTLEALEALGAELVEFSPLRDEGLPPGVDLVMIGCGMPDVHVEKLASNVSMMAALRQHVCRGHRIYSEGGGAAYLGRCMIVEGQAFPGAGILPFDAELLANPGPPAPVTRVLSHDSWMGAEGTEVRGYKSGRWRFIPRYQKFACPATFGSLTTDGDLFYHHHAVGSLIHLHLGALPEVVGAFAGTHRPSLRRPSMHDLADQF
jgi:cobyrinic acid a,c-diamide synthase